MAKAATTKIQRISLFFTQVIDCLTNANFNKILNSIVCRILSICFDKEKNNPAYQTKIN